MKSDSNLEILLYLTIVLTVVIFIAKVSYFFLLIPTTILIIGLASDKLAKGIVITLLTMLNLLVQLISKTLLTIFFFVVLLPVIFFHGLFQKLYAHKTPKSII